MPFAKLTLANTPPAVDCTRLSEALTTLIAEALGKRHGLTSVLIETPGQPCWTIGGVRQRTAAHLELYVTAGTNTAEQKRNFLARAMVVLHEVLPGLDPASYIIVNEVPAADWGYDGISQADRAGGNADVR